METKNNLKDSRSNVMKQALARRQTERLPSNFSYRMMERVRLEAEKKNKRKVWMGWIALLLSSMSLLGLGVYCLVFYLDFSFADYLPRIDVQRDSSLFIFYFYIAILVLILLGLDYWLRKKYFWK